MHVSRESIEIFKTRGQPVLRPDLNGTAVAARLHLKFRSISPTTYGGDNSPAAKNYRPESPPSGGGFVGTAQGTHGEIDDGLQRRLRAFAERRVLHAGQQHHVDRAVALLLRDLDLLHRAVLVVFALNDQDRHTDISEL